MYIMMNGSIDYSDIRNCVFRLSNFDEGSFEKQTYSEHTMN